MISTQVKRTFFTYTVLFVSIDALQCCLVSGLKKKKVVDKLPPQQQCQPSVCYHGNIMMVLITVVLLKLFCFFRSK